MFFAGIFEFMSLDQLVKTKLEMRVTKWNDAAISFYNQTWEARSSFTITSIARMFIFHKNAKSKSLFLPVITLFPISHSHSYNYTHTLLPIHTPSVSLSNTHTHTDTHKHTHTHTAKHTLFFFIFISTEVYAWKTSKIVLLEGGLLFNSLKLI